MSYAMDTPPDAALLLDLDVLAADTLASRALGPFTASGVMYTGAGLLTGVNVMATTATVAQIAIYDGGGTGAQLIKQVDVSQGAGKDQQPTFPGIRLRRGLYLNVVAGSPLVVVYLVAQEALDALNAG